MVSLPAWQPLDDRVLEALRVGDHEPMTIVDVADAVGRAGGGLDELVESLHRLERHGLSEVWRRPGDPAAYHRRAVTVVDVIPVDLGTRRQQ